MPSRNLSILFLCLLLSLLCATRASQNRYATTIAEAMGQIHANYVEPVEHRELYEGAMEGIVRQLDPYSGFVKPEEYQALLEDLDQEFGGVGIIVDLDTSSGRLIVLSPVFGSPAFEAGLRAGDLILEIDGEDTEGLNANDAVVRIRGQPGTSVTLTIQSPTAESPRAVTLKRGTIPVESVLGDLRHEDGSWQFTLQQQPRLGYVRLISFGEKSAADLQRALQDILPQIEGLILDLRGNAGGLLDAAIDTCDMFLDQGLIVSIKGRGGRLQQAFQARAQRLVPPQLPVVVLVDRYSASASEIVAACLQDHQRATIVGEQTWGKGTVQSVFELEGGRSALRLTTATYWRPSGKNIHRLPRSDLQDWGVQPDSGWLVELDDAERGELLRARRQRDVAPSNHPAGDPPAHPDSPSEAVRDRQLEQAIQAVTGSTASVARLYSGAPTRGRGGVGCRILPRPAPSLGLVASAARATADLRPDAFP